MEKILLRKATRKKVKLRIGMAGTSGSGKTYSALLMASGMTSWDKVALIDTENGSGELYSHLGDYSVITLTAPFMPEKYLEAIRECEKAGMEVIIIDSITHEWDGEGGLLEVHSKMPGNSFTNWAKITPRHNAFIQGILQSSCHVITTVRKKQDYDMAQNNGKLTVTKVGLKEIQREGFEYELTVNFEIDISHNATAGKDRTGLFMDKPGFIISSAAGKTLLDWCNKGEDVSRIQEKSELEILKETEFQEKPEMKKQAVLRFETAFAELAAQEKWTPEILKKNYAAITGGEKSEKLDLSKLILMAQAMEKKIKQPIK